MTSRANARPAARCAPGVSRIAIERSSRSSFCLDLLGLDPAWTVHELSLEDLILAYLDSGDARANHEAWGVPA